MGNVEPVSKKIQKFQLFFRRELAGKKGKNYHSKPLNWVLFHRLVQIY